MEIDVVYQDAHLLAVDKPHGLLSVPGIGADKRDCLISRMQAEFPEARIVHRLDRDTSGIMVLARDPDTHRELSRQFHDREVVKRYVAVVAGHMQDAQGEINLPIRKDMNPQNKPRHIVDYEHGRPSVTRWTVLEQTEIGSPPSLHPVTRVSLRPVTGRSHQLRVHLKEISHPIVGDDLYAPPEILSLADRLMLHAEYLLVTDPYTAQPREFTVNVPF